MAFRETLLDDDSRNSRKILKSCLPEDQEHGVYEADGGQEGLSKFSEANPGVTFLDVNMPAMGGIRCLEEIKKIDEKAIIIMCTANVQSKAVLKAAALGAIAISRKPLSKDAVRDVLN